MQKIQTCRHFQASRGSADNRDRNDPNRTRQADQTTRQAKRSAVHRVDFSGYIASSLVFLTFYMSGMVTAALDCVLQQLAFLVYAGWLHLIPVFLRR